MTYQLRSDKTVLTTDINGNAIVYRLRAGQAGTALEATKVSAPTDVALWGTDPTVYYDSTAAAMLQGQTPKEGHGFLGFLAGLAVGIPTGFWIIGPIAGAVAGHLVKTKESDAQMTPVIQVSGAMPPPGVATMAGERRRHRRMGWL